MSIAIKIKEKVQFKFAYRHNAENVAFALCSAGYYVRIVKGSDIEYNVLVYTTDLKEIE